jgi:hypothetical protein
MRKYAIIRAAAFLLFAAPLFIASAQDGGIGTLAGIVLSAQGKPVAGASVTMETANGGSPHATVTNLQGRFFFPELTHGYYDLRATHKGLTSEWKHNIEVTTGKETDVKLQLMAAQKKS